MAPPDYSQRFIFEDLDIRGEYVHLENTFQTVLSKNQYPKIVQLLLGELISATVLLNSILKFEGYLAIHAQGNGPIRLLVSECSDENGVRAIAHFSEEQINELENHTSLSDLIAKGKLAILIQPTQGKQYQGIVPLSGNTLAECLEHYFEQSEQLATRIYLTSDSRIAGGLLLQQLPAEQEPSNNKEHTRHNWEHATSLANTLRHEELLHLPADKLLNRLYAQDAIRIFEPQQVSFKCRCSREKTSVALRSLTKNELEDIIKEKQSISVDCQFCTKRYEFTRRDLSLLFDESVSGKPAGTLH